MFQLLPLLLLAGSPQATVAVSSVRTSPADQSVHYTLTSPGQKAIVAWSTRVITHYPSGFSTTVVITKDTYESSANLSLGFPLEAPLAAGESRTEAVFVGQQRKENPARADVDVIAAVYADRSAVGDPSYIRSIFESRTEKGRGWADVATILDDTLATKGVADEVDAAGVEAAIDKLDALNAQDNNVIRESMVYSLSQLLSQHHANGDDLGTAVRLFLTQAHLRRDTAYVHAHRQPS